MNKTVCCILLAVSFTFISCKQSKEISRTSKEFVPVEDLLREIENNKTQFEWLSAKMRVSYKDSRQSRNFTANIRMQKDSVIWISVTTLLGIEAARILIKNDSVYFLNRLQRQYKESSLKLLEDYLPFPFDITLLQNILVGNPILFPTEKAKLKQEKNEIKLVTEHHSIVHTMILDTADYKISTEHLLDKQTQRHVSLIFNDYQFADDKLFSFNRNIDFKGEQDVELSLNFSKVKWDEPLEFPFHVSEKYE